MQHFQEGSRFLRITKVPSLFCDLFSARFHKGVRNLAISSVSSLEAGDGPTSRSRLRLIAPPVGSEPLDDAAAERNGSPTGRTSSLASGSPQVSRQQRHEAETEWRQIELDLLNEGKVLSAVQMKKLRFLACAEPKLKLAYGICRVVLFPPNLPPKIHQYPTKIDTLMASHLDFVF